MVHINDSFISYFISIHENKVTSAIALWIAVDIPFVVVGSVFACICARDNVLPTLLVGQYVFRFILFFAIGLTLWCLADANRMKQQLEYYCDEMTTTVPSGFYLNELSEAFIHGTNDRQMRIFLGMLEETYKCSGICFKRSFYQFYGGYGYPTQSCYDPLIQYNEDRIFWQFL